MKSMHRHRLFRWILNDGTLFEEFTEKELNSVDGLRLCAFILIHAGCLGVFFVGTGWLAIAFAAVLYFTRMFFITAFYHRYFSHRTYKVSRVTQFVMAVLGCTAGQRGPIWWASHHREHHRTSDTDKDPHSPNNGFLDSHVLWFLRRRNFSTITSRVKDLQRYPELRWLEKFDWLPYAMLFAACFIIGEILSVNYPGLNTSGSQLLVWGGFISTTLLYHATFTINSLAHVFGKRRFQTSDDSRNNLWLALLTLGEGWHNNHHRFPVSARQGFYRGEIDISYLLLSCLGMLGLARDFRYVPAHILEEGRRT